MNDMKQKKLFVLILMLCLALVLSSCGKEKDGSAVTVTDMAGREVKIAPGSYKKVVCIGAGALRMYSYIGDVKLLCGVEDIDNLTLESRPKVFDASPRPYVMGFGDVFSKLPSCGTGGPNAQTAEAEKILSCGPDIVISEYEDADKANALQAQLGVPVITLRSGPAGVFGEEFKGSMRLLGKVFAADKRAEELVSFVENETKELGARTADIAESAKPSVYVCGLGNWGTANHLMTAENYTTFAAANIKNAVSGLGIKGIGAIEEEKFVSLGETTDIMFIDAAAVKNITPLYKADKTLFDTCKAWQNGEVYLVMAYNSYYTNYEIALSNAWFMAKTVYPDRFTDIDVDAKLNGITKMFLGKELAKAVYACPASYGGYQKIDTDKFFE